MRFFSTMTRVLRLALVSLLALGLAVLALLLGMAMAGSLLVLAGIERMRARRDVSGRGVGQGSDMRSGTWPKERLDVVDIEFREKRWSDGRAGPA